MEHFKNLNLNPSQFPELGDEDKAIISIKIAIADVTGDPSRGMSVAIINDKYIFQLRACPVAMPGLDLGVPLHMLLDEGMGCTPLSKIEPMDDGKHGFFRQVDEKATCPFQYGTYLHEVLMRAVVEHIVNRAITIEKDVVEYPEVYEGLEPFVLAYEYTIIGDMEELAREAAMGGAAAHFGIDAEPKFRAQLTITELYSFIDYEVPDGRTLN